MHVYTVLKPVFYHISTNMRLIGGKIDNIFIPAPLVGFGRRGQVNSLKDIGLTLRIVTIKNICPTVKFH